MWISKQDVYLCLKVNKEQQKCHTNCLGRVCKEPEKYITTEVFNPGPRGEQRGSRRHAVEANSYRSPVKEARLDIYLNMV